MVLNKQGLRNYFCGLNVLRIGIASAIYEWSYTYICLLVYNNDVLKMDLLYSKVLRVEYG